MVKSGKKDLAYDSFRVDEFVLPTFTLSFDPNDKLYLKGDEVVIKGKVQSFSGHSLTGANLAVKVSHWDSVILEQDIQPALRDGGVDLEMDCTELTYMASSGLRIIQKTMRTVTQLKGQFKITNVSPEIYKILAMTGFTKFMKVEQKKD